MMRFILDNKHLRCYHQCSLIPKMNESFEVIYF